MFQHGFSACGQQGIVTTFDDIGIGGESSFHQRLNGTGKEHVIRIDEGYVFSFDLFQASVAGTTQSAVFLINNLKVIILFITLQQFPGMIG